MNNFKSELLFEKIMKIIKIEKYFNMYIYILYISHDNIYFLLHF